MNTVKFENGKYALVIDGKVVSKSSSKYYLERKLKEYEQQDQTPKKESKYTINQRFQFLEQMVSMVADGTMSSCVITGQGGLGKSFTVMKSMEKMGIKNITDLAQFQVDERVNKKNSFRIIKGFSTAKGLYRTLFESNGMTVVFDDCDSIMKDDIARNLLKGALDSFSKRYISWNADMRDEDLPRSFEFTGRVIFVSNMPLEKIDQAIRTRCMVVDLSMTEEQKLERMEVIAKSDEFLPEIGSRAKIGALEFLKSNIGQVENLSLRTLIQVTKIANRGGDWKQFAEYVITQGA